MAKEVFDVLILFAVAAGTIVLASLLEGLLHQFVLHTNQKRVLFGVLKGAFRAHSVEHHPAYRAETYHRPAPDDEKRISLGWYTLPLILAILSPVFILLWVYVSWLSAFVFYGVLVAYYTTYEVLHWHMHFPSRKGKPRWYLQLPIVRSIFQWFNARHYVHHLADDRNFNVVLPVYDLLFGRYTTHIGQVPWAVRWRQRRARRRSQLLRKQRTTPPSG